MSRDGAIERVVLHHLASNRGRCRLLGLICCSRHVPRRRKKAVDITKRAGGDTPIVLTSSPHDGAKKRAGGVTPVVLAEGTADLSDPFSNHRRQRPVLLALLAA